VNLSLLLEIVRQRRWMFVVALLCTIAALGLMVFRLSWQEPDLEALRAEWFAKRDLSGGGTRNPVDVYRQGQADLAAVQQRIPQRKEFVRLLGDLYELAGNNRLTIGGISYKPQAAKEAKDSPLLAYELTLTAAGSYAAMKSFVADLERMDDMTVIDNLTVSGGKDEAGQTVDVKIVMTAYFRSEGT
jgi:hypothetical protein